MNLSLDNVFSSGGETGGNSGAQLSLSDIFNGFVASVAGSAASGVSNLVDNKTRSQVAAPSPDLAAVAAKPQTASFLDSSVMGVSMPILLIGSAALVFLLVRK